MFSFLFSSFNDTFGEDSSLLLMGLPGDIAVDSEDFDALCSTKNGYEFPQEQKTQEQLHSLNKIFLKNVELG